MLSFFKKAIHVLCVLKFGRDDMISSILLNIKTQIVKLLLTCVFHFIAKQYFQYVVRRVENGTGQGNLVGLLNLIPSRIHPPLHI